MYLHANLKTYKHIFLLKMKVLMGKNVRIFSEDREVLEKLIFPHYLDRSDIQSVLFVGCAPYTHHYNEIWKSKNYWTIDSDSDQRKYGAENHIVGSIEYLSHYFSKDYFDLIVCNGVYGFGLNSKDGCERAFTECFHALRTGGEFILGWNNVPQFTPVPLAEIGALGLFHPKVFPLFGNWRYECNGGILHIFDFYVKPSRI